jgi:hypothetical protein
MPLRGRRKSKKAKIKKARGKREGKTREKSGYGFWGRGSCSDSAVSSSVFIGVHPCKKVASAMSNFTLKQSVTRLYVGQAFEPAFL